MERWSRSNKIEFITLLVAILGIIATLVVPELRRFFNLDEPDTSSGIVERIKSLPLKVWIIFGIAVLLWFILRRIFKRLRAIKQPKGAYIGIVNAPPFGWEPVGTFNHAGVRWLVQSPKKHFVRITETPRVDPSQFSIHTPPMCPKCNTELEETKKFTGSYLWTCVKCGFRKKNKDTYRQESKRALKIAKSTFNS